MRGATSMRWVTLAASAALLSACGSVPEVPVQLVAVDTGRVTGATCLLEVPGARSVVEATPAVAAVPLTRGDLRVTCTKEGFAESVRVFPNLLRTEAVVPVVERSLVNSEPFDPTPVVGYPEMVSLFMVPAPEAAPAAPAAVRGAEPVSAPRAPVEVVPPRVIPTAPPPVIPTTRNPVGAG